MGIGSRLFGSLFGVTRTSAPITKPEGTSGVTAYGGYVDSGERHPSLIGDNKWRTFTNAKNKSTIATGIRLRADLIAATEWTLTENAAGGKDAQRGLEIIDQGLLKAPMPTPWQQCVRKQSLFQFDGAHLHEPIMRRRADGMIVCASIEDRPMWTVKQWDIADEQSPWQGVVQQSRSGKPYYVERERLWYSADNLLGETPDGVGLLRQLVELVRRLDLLEELEIFGYETDLRGMAMVRAPLAQLRAESNLPPGPQQDAFVKAATADIRRIAQNQIKTPEKPQYLVTDSMPWIGADKNTFAALRQWDLELLKGETNGLPDAARLIERLHLECARLMGIEHVLMGGGRSGGSYSMHEDKTSMLATSLQCAQMILCSSAQNDIVQRLIALNGLDPDTAAPTLVAAPISTDAVLTVAQTLAALSLAGMDARDPAYNVMRSRMLLPPAPDMPPADAGVLPRGPRMGAPPDPKLGEVDVDLDENERDGKPAPGKAAA